MSSQGGLPCLLPADSELRNIIEKKENPFLEKIFSRARTQPVISDEEDEFVEDVEDWETFKADEEMKLELLKGAECLSLLDRGDNMSNITGTNLSDLETATIATFYSSGSSIADEDLQTQYNFGPTNRQALPVDAHREQILQLVKDNSVVILSGHTGCGKTTQVPQFILEGNAYMKEEVNIIVTQPRKIAAKSVAQRVCNERGWAMGGIVGYHVGLDKMNKSPDTRLLYVTTGVLKMMLINDHNTANKYTHIILDEVHERELDTDFVLVFLKKLMMTSVTKFRLILMSATIDELKFQNYFSEKRGSGLMRAPCLNIGNVSAQKTNQPVRVTYLDKFDVDMGSFSLSEPRLNDNAVEACEKAMKMLLQMDKTLNVKTPGAVLIFLPGINEIERLHTALKNLKQDPRAPPFEIIPLHSSLSWEEHGRIFKEVGPNKRKVILSTNIAESSITVTDIVYLIDFCLTKNVETDPATGYPQLQLCWASKQQIEQRKGRVGRVARGHVFRLIPEIVGKNLVEEHEPEMCRVPLTKLVLEIKQCRFGSPKELLAIAMKPPNLEDISKAIMYLKTIGALLTTCEGVESKDDGDLTVLGEIVVKLPVDVQLGKLIVFGYIFGLLDECCIIAAGLNGKEIFSAFFDSRLNSYMSKLHWTDKTASDFNAILLAYKSWENRGQVSRDPDKGFYSAYNLQKKQLMEMKELIKEIKCSLKYMNLEEPENSPKSKFSLDEHLLMDIVIFGAFFPNYFVRYHNDEREKLAHRALLKNDPLNSVYLLGLPKDHAKFGELYKNQLKELLSKAVPEEQIERFQFDYNKIIICFKKDPNCQLSQSVLSAMKLGKVYRKDLWLKLYDPEKAKRIYSAFKSSASKDSARGIVIEPMPAPDMKISNIQFRLAHVDCTPHSFWIEYPEHEQHQGYIKRIIDTKIDECPSISDPSKVQVGDFYLAPYMDFGYYRVMVEQKKEAGFKVRVFYIDYGNVEIVPITTLRSIPVHLWADLSTHALAVECSLAGIQPNQTRNVKNYWDAQAIQQFQMLLQKGMESGRHFHGTVFCDLPSGHGLNRFMLKLSKVTMYDLDGVEVDVGRWLLENGYAEKSTDSYNSQMRAKERLEFRSQNDDMQSYLNNPERYREEEGLQYTVGKDLETLPCQLKGPYSPLEADVVSLYKDTRFSKAKINHSSVNSILLDPNPGAPHMTWLVAAHVEIKPESTEFLLRNTSWMPSKPGIGPVCAMMFGPRVQLRTNDRKTNYTGCLVGLGCSSTPHVTKKGNSFKPFNPQYDMEIEFDCRIGIDEVFLVNGVRHHLGQVLARGPDGIWRINQRKFLHETREEIKKNLNLLFSKELAYKEPERSSGTKDFCWYGAANRSTNFNIFRSLEGPKLLSVSSQLRHLSTFADSEDSTPFDTAVYCPACSKCLESPRDMHEHLSSRGHRETVARMTSNE